jgi:flagellar hook-associated protein 3 FlgL
MTSQLPGATEKYLADLSRLQASVDKAQRQVSSGFRVERASDDPSAVGGILQIQSELSANATSQANLSEVGAELTSADSGLQSAIHLMDRAISLATQASNTGIITPRSAIAQEVQAIQQELVAVSQTAVNGRYIFSGDSDTAPQYVLDPTKPNGVRQTGTAASTRIIQDSTGIAIAVARSAQQIFDARNPDGTPAAGNAFEAIGSLLRGLLSDDPSTIQTAVSSLEAASGHLNLQAAFYGAAQNRVTHANELSNKFQLQKQSELSDLRDADLPDAALRLTQGRTMQEAALTTQAKLTKLSLFDYMA